MNRSAYMSSWKKPIIPTGRMGIFVKGPVWEGSCSHCGAIWDLLTGHKCIHISDEEERVVLDGVGN